MRYVKFVPKDRPAKTNRYVLHPKKYNFCVVERINREATLRNIYESTRITEVRK